MNNICLVQADPLSHPIGEKAKLRLDNNIVFRDGLLHVKKKLTNSVCRTSKYSRFVLMDRRFFLKTSGIGLASFGLMAVAPDFLHQFAAAQTVAKAMARKRFSLPFFSAVRLMD